MSGERTWRRLLKADPNVDLVHFTILRPPEKQDGTPVKELALIAFPTRELFVDKLDVDVEVADILIAAGFEWRMAGCSMCLAMNPDQLSPGERCASTSNRNFEGRQGRGGRTHLLSPAMAAAAAITGHLTDVRDLMGIKANA